MSKKQKIIYNLITADNKQEFETKMTECLNHQEIKFEIIGSLIIEDNTFYQAVLGKKITTTKITATVIQQKSNVSREYGN